MRGKSGDFCSYVDEVSKSMHWYFEPSPLSDVVRYLDMDAVLTELLISAHRSLGILEGMMRSLPYVDHFEDMVIRNEVCMSCAIDAIAISPTVMIMDSVKTENKRLATNSFRATKSLEKQFLTTELLCNLHAIVMKNITINRPGRLRNTPFLMNRHFNVKMEEYNPPLPNSLAGMLENMLDFAKEKGKTDPLIKAALTYYQFETIHPFDSGNGLVGRLLPSLVLMNEDIISRPMLSLSSYFCEKDGECEKQFHKNQHFGRYLDWIKFFVQGIIVSVNHTISQIDLTILLKQENLKRIKCHEKSSMVLSSIYDYIEQKPVVSIQDIADNQTISYNTATKYVKIMESVGILKQINGQSRYRLFAFEDYLNIFDA